ncbi:hypothetical protein [Longitalea luteola]|uniref:hypothetical protein n=1 Tax=Longitalea luteola TaxID=2812563 RepID=UPI001A96508F|nr:hypothetical protein [Longitalea luteola]
MNRVLNWLKLKNLLRQPFFVFHILAVIVLWIFVWRHAFNMDITYDEAYSFRLVKTNHFRAMPGTANTHWLNSFFMKLFTVLFGDEPGYFRIHSILAFPFFAHGVYTLAAQIRGQAIQFAFYCLILFNPFLLDFFSLARGYGMALMFQVWSIVFLLKAGNASFSYRHWLLVVILSALMLASNLSYIYTIFGITGGFLLHCMVTGNIFSWYTNKQKRTITILFALIISFAIADLLFITLYGKDKGFGGSENFFLSVFDSLWQESLYLAPYSPISIWFSYCSLILIIIASLYFTIDAVKQKKLTTGCMVCLIIASILLLNFIFHLLFNTFFLKNRLTLQWYIPGILIICLIFSKWTTGVKYSRLQQYGFALLTGLATILHWAKTSNSSFCIEWYYQAHSSQVINDLSLQQPKHPMVSSTLYVLYEHYYSVIDDRLTPAAELEEGPYALYDDAIKQAISQSDYLLTYYPETLDFMNSNHISYSIIKSYPLTQTKLVKIVHP